MDILALLLAAVALVVALVALSRSSRAGGTSRDDTNREMRRLTSNLETDLRHDLEVTRRLLAEVVRGAPLTAEAILDGQLWRDVEPDEAVELVQREDVVVVDVRTPSETRAGFLPGARLIPMDELDERKNEIPREGRVLIYCAMGSRSAAACEGLSREGWSGLMNLTGGVGSWRGPIVRP
jgi:rhodanese-related sulfurtransferase